MNYYGFDLFRKCAKTHKPVYFSVGMATNHEVETALNCLIKEGSKEIKILHCNSSYPTPIKDVNLAAIKSLKWLCDNINIPDNVDVDIGYSDHTVSESVIYRAVYSYDVNIIEFHLDLDRKGKEYKSGHCWLPKKISNVIKNINDGFQSDGSKKIKPSESEMYDREWRADPSDGLRPLKKIRKDFNE